MKQKNIIIWLVLAILAYVIGYFGYQAIKPEPELNDIQKQAAPSLPNQ